MIALSERPSIMIKLAVNERRSLLKQPIDLVYKIYEHFSLFKRVDSVF